MQTLVAGDQWQRGDQLEEVREWLNERLAGVNLTANEVYCVHWRPGVDGKGVLEVVAYHVTSGRRYILGSDLRPHEPQGVACIKVDIMMEQAPPWLDW